MDPNYIPTSEYGRAMQTLRAGKNVFWWLIVLSVLVQIAAFALVRWGGVLDTAQSRVQYSAAATHPAPGAAKADAPTDEAVATTGAQQVEVTVIERRGAIWEFWLDWALATTKFLAFVSALILTLLVGIHVPMSLVGRLGGAADFVRAIMWALVLLALLTPWQQVLQASVVRGALYSLGELQSHTRLIRPQWRVAEPSLWQQIIYYTRFLADPIIAGLVALVVQGRLRAGYQSMVLPVDGRPA